MLVSFRSWLDRLPFDDPLTRQHARLLQGFLIILLAVFTPATPMSLLGGGAGVGPLLRFSANIFLLIGLALSLVMLRRGHLQFSLLGIVVSLLITEILTLIVLGLTVGAGLLLVPIIPLILVGLLGSRRMALFTLLANSAGIMLILVLEQQTPPLAGIDPPRGNLSWITGFDFVLVGAVSIFMLDHFARAFRDALHLARTREATLEQVQQQQAAIIAERTHDLQQALAHTTEQKQALEGTLQALHTSQATVHALSAPHIPVLPGVLVMPLTGQMDAARLAQMMDTLLPTVATEKIAYVILDSTGLAVVDHAVAMGFQRLATALHLLGAESLFVGIRPEVAETIVSLSIDTTAWQFYANLQAAVSTLIPRIARR